VTSRELYCCMYKNQTRVVTNGNFHFQRLGLDQPGLLMLIREMQGTLKDPSQEVKSISLSYNDKLGDIGVNKLVEFLPSNLNSLGLVDCNISDKGGAKLLGWIKSATDLKMFCVEHNHFSGEMKILLQHISRVKGFDLFI